MSLQRQYFMKKLLPTVRLIYWTNIAAAAFCTTTRETVLIISRHMNCHSGGRPEFRLMMTLKSELLSLSRKNRATYHDFIKLTPIIKCYEFNDKMGLPTCREVKVQRPRSSNGFSNFAFTSVFFPEFRELLKKSLPQQLLTVSFELLASQEQPIQPRLLCFDLASFSLLTIVDLKFGDFGAFGHKLILLWDKAKSDIYIP